MLQQSGVKPWEDFFSKYRWCRAKVENRYSFTKFGFCSEKVAGFRKVTADRRKEESSARLVCIPESPICKRVSLCCIWEDYVCVCACLCVFVYSQRLIFLKIAAASWQYNQNDVYTHSLLSIVSVTISSSTETEYVYTCVR